MAKKAKADEAAAVEAEPKAKKGQFTVLDSNGKAVRVVDTEEEAQALAQVYAGRIQR